MDDITLSILCTVPFVALRSVVIVFAVLPIASMSITFLSFSTAVNVFPPNVFIANLPLFFLIAFTTSAALKLPATIC